MATSAVRKPGGPLWPFVVGAIVIVAGIALGFGVSVGPHCEGAFSTNQLSASGADIANAYAGEPTDYTSACHAMAGQQAGIYWGIIGFGAALLVLGLVLGHLARRPAAVAASAPVAVAAPPHGGVAAELAHLAQLRDHGLLTAGEFDQQKAKLLGG